MTGTANKQPRSLRRQLMAWITVPVLITGFLIALMAFTFTWREIEEVYDAQMVHAAKFILQLADHEIYNNGNTNFTLAQENPNLHHKYENKIGYRVWYKDAIVTASANIPDFGSFEAPPGFSDQVFDHKPWRFFVFIDPPRHIRVEASERYAIRYELIGQLMLSLLAPALLFVPAIMLAIAFGVRYSLRPLLALSQGVNKRDSGDMTPVNAQDTPAEVLPLLNAINGLLARLSEIFRRERELTDHAAHELRTPLAAMKMQTQVLMKKAGDNPDCREGLDNLHATIIRATHLVEQLLSFARLQNEDIAFTPVDLRAILYQAVDELKEKARAKGLTLAVITGDTVTMRAHADSLNMMIRNVLDNAIKYTPDNGHIDVELVAGRLTVADSGPGLADSDKDRVFGRFVRADKSGQGGSGLGLSIVRWVADLHGIAVTLTDNRPHGLVVTLSWDQNTI